MAIKFKTRFRFTKADEAAVKIEVMVLGKGETKFRALEHKDCFDAYDLIRLGRLARDVGRAIQQTGHVDPAELERVSDKEETS